MVHSQTITSNNSKEHSALTISNTSSNSSNVKQVTVMPMKWTAAVIAATLARMATAIAIAVVVTTAVTRMADAVDASNNSKGAVGSISNSREAVAMDAAALNNKRLSLVFYDSKKKLRVMRGAFFLPNYETLDRVGLFIKRISARGNTTCCEFIRVFFVYSPRASRFQVFWPFD